jgi:general secretion pathway protein A
MYKEFYGFTTFPFALTPDPQFLYPSENYKNCLFYLLYGLEREYGLLVVTGEIGTGKTFLLNTLMQKLDKNTHVASLVHSKLDDFDILQYASKELRLDIAGQSKAELLINLKNFLLTYEMKNEKVILFIDEAQNLSVDVLEELRLLTNFENAEKKLLQIVLVGQLQLEDKLRLPELTQLSQRIGFSCRLLPMDYNETKGYIETRLSVAGVTYPVFTPQAIQEIFVRSKGIPRVINLICDLALLFGFSEEKREIGPPIIKQVMHELNLYTPEKAGKHSIRQKRDATVAYVKGFIRPNRLALMAGIAALSLLGAGAILQSELISSKLGAYMTRTVPDPLAALPQNSSAREQPSLPQSDGVREQPLLPQSGGVREQPKKIQWVQTIISYQITTGKPLAVFLPPLQRSPASLPVKVTLDTSNSTPVWLKFDAGKLALSGTPPLQETGKTYHLTFRAQTADGMESRLQLALNLVAQTKP